MLRFSPKLYSCRRKALVSIFSKCYFRNFSDFGFRRSHCLHKKWSVFSNHLQFNAISTFHVHDCQTHSRRRIPRMNIVPTTENEDCRRWTAHCGPTHRLDLRPWRSLSGLFATFWVLSAILCPLKKPLSPLCCPLLWSTLQKTDCGCLWMPFMFFRGPLLNVQDFSCGAELMSRLPTLSLHQEPFPPQLSY